LVFIVFTTFTFLASYIFIYKYMPEYSGSLKYLFPLCISMLFQSIYFLYVNYLFYYRKTKVLMYITFLVSILHIILSYLLTPYSVQFTAYISVFSSSLICLLVYLYSKHLLKFNLQQL
jgi:O-antigen/teichoic acid export membrane protein